MPWRRTTQVRSQTAQEIPRRWSTAPGPGPRWGAKDSSRDRAVLDPEDRVLPISSHDVERAAAIGADDQDLDLLTVEHQPTRRPVRVSVHDPTHRSEEVAIPHIGEASAP